MKIATILVPCAILAASGMARAQTTPGTASAKNARSGPSKAAHPDASQSKASDDIDRMIDSEQKRMKRVMNICTGC